MTLLVSIIIPVFNGEAHIHECIASAINQTYQNIEIIVVDNGSTDGTREILKSFKDERINIIETANNGACKARNIGFTHSKGDYIQFLDSDDYLSHNKIEEQLKVLENTSEHIAICKTLIVKDGITFSEPSSIDDPWLVDSNNPFDFLLNLYGHYGMIQTNVWLVPRVLIIKAGLWNEELKQDQDGEFYCRVVLGAKGIKFSKFAINYYRRYLNHNNIGNNKSLMAVSSTIKALDLKASYLLAHNDSKETEEVIAMHYKVLAVRYYGVYPSLYNEAMAKCIALNNSSFIPVMGGRTVQALTRVLGWKYTKKLILLKNGKNL